MSETNRVHPTIGFIGIGNMGWPMASNLVKARHEVVAYDVDASRAAQFVKEKGGRSAGSLAELGASDVIVTMLPTGAIVRQLLIDGGLGASLAPGAIVVDMSSSEPIGSRELGAALARFGVAFIDAPVSGGVARAVTGTLAIMYGSDDAIALEKVLPILRSMGDRLFATGGLGSGHAMKALNNFVAAAGYAATAEAMLIGERFGLDPATMMDILNVSTGRNFFTDVVMKEHVIGKKFATGFTVGLLAKDVKIAADLGVAMDQDTPVLDLIAERWAHARDTIGAGKDNSAAILAWKDRRRA